MAAKKKSEHLIVRFSDKVGDVVTDVIEVHSKILRKRGEVIIGKFGRVISDQIVETIGERERSNVLVSNRPRARRRVRDG